LPPQRRRPEARQQIFSIDDPDPPHEVHASGPELSEKEVNMMAAKKKAAKKPAAKKKAAKKK
jgi:hypothetical protein